MIRKISKNQFIIKRNIPIPIKTTESIKTISIQNKKVLVIMPTYNRPQKCIDVINNMLEQLYENFTLLIIDDGSEIKNYNILCDHVNTLHNDKIVLKRNEYNKQIPKTLNIGLQYFLENNYENVSWISDDNVYYTNYISNLLVNNSDFSYTSYDYGFNNIIKKIDKQYKNTLDVINNYVGLASFMWSRNAIIKIGFYDENLYGSEDYDYLLRTFINITDIKYNNISTMKYIKHPDSLFVRENTRILKLKTTIDTIYKKLLENTKYFIYYSKTSWLTLFQRPHQIIRHFDKSYLKIFITNDDIIKYEEEYNTLVVSYQYKNILFNVIKSNFIIYYTDSRLYEEIKEIKENNNNIKILYDLIDAPIDEFKVWLPNLKLSINSADYVIYSHPELIKFLKEINDQKEYNYISNGCDYKHFSKAQNRIYPKPSDIPNVDKPILGYYGAFSTWLDYNIIKRHADENKYHILMIGGIPNIKNYNIRFRHKNITWLDHKTYEELPTYLSWFDVCFLPFKKCELIKYVNPCKLWEYIASHKDIIKYNVNMKYDDIVTYDDINFNLKNILGINMELDEEDFMNKIIDGKLYDNIYILLPTIPWNTILYQRPQHIAHALSTLNTLVIYITDYDNIPLKKYKQIKCNLWLSNNNEELYNIPNVFYSIYSTSYQNDLIQYYDTIIKNKSFLIYEYIDHIDPKISGDNCDILEFNKKCSFNGTCHSIMSSATALYDETKIATINNLMLVPNGVNLKHYIEKKDKVFNFKDNIQNFRKKYKVIVGYFGAIAPWLDYKMLNNVVLKCNDIGFMFIGPDYFDSVKKLPNYDNFLYIGPIDYNDLPYYAYLFDICIILFAEGDIAKTTSPLKLYEYFSLQKPVVVTSFMLECTKYDVVFHADNTDGICNKIYDSIKYIDNEEYKVQVFNLAKENTWIKRAIVIKENMKLIEHKTTYVTTLINSNNINLFDIPKEKYKYCHVWGVNVCQIIFNAEDKYKYKNTEKKYNMLILKIYAFQLSQIYINIKDQQYSFDIKNNIQNYTINITVNNNDTIEIYSKQQNTFCIKDLKLIYV